MHEWVMVVVPFFIAAACLGTLGLGLWLLVDSVWFSCVAARGVGRVVRMHSQWEVVNRSNDSGSWTERVMVHYPVIAFVDGQGVRHEARANVGNFCAPGYRIGEEVPIRFLQRDPQSMRIASFTSLYWNATCLLFIAAGGSILLLFWLCYV